MQNISVVAFLGLIYTIPTFAANDDFDGKFKGTEKTVTTNCANASYNGKSESVWQAEHKVSGQSYTGKGSNSTGSFDIEGTISDQGATQKLKGTNRWGLSWTGESTAKMEDGKLLIQSKGIVPASGCEFVSEVTATKQ